MAEKKYIELQKALNVCEMHYEHCLEMHDWNGDTTADNIKRDIETIPTADVVEVVRCKDCRNFGEDVGMSKDGVWARCFLHQRIMCEKDYCSYGERTPKERGNDN